MKAAAGDRLLIKGHYVGEPDRDAEILEHFLQHQSRQRGS